MISVSEALDALFALANPLDIETVPLSDAAGRVLAVSAVAERDQPPFRILNMKTNQVRHSNLLTVSSVIVK